MGLRRCRGASLAGRAWGVTLLLRPPRGDDDGLEWFAFLGPTGLLPGTAIELGREAVVWGRSAFVGQADGVVYAEKLDPSALPDRVEEIRASGSPLAPPPLPPPPGAAPGRGGESDKKEPPEDETDVRVLPVVFDSGEERWRKLEEALPFYTEEDFLDWPLAGPRSTGYACRQLRRSGLTWNQQHEVWVQRSGGPCQ